jgi:hypothetical protein
MPPRKLPFPPMEAELVDELPTGDWQYEPKWDGFRGILENIGGGLRLWSETGDPTGTSGARGDGALLPEIPPSTERSCLPEGRPSRPVQLRPIRRAGFGSRVRSSRVRRRDILLWRASRDEPRPAQTRAERGLSASGSRLSTTEAGETMSRSPRPGRADGVWPSGSSRRTAWSRDGVVDRNRTARPTA